MRREGACPCGAVRYSIDGPVRDVLVCHCGACRRAAGGPWSASAVKRADLEVDAGSALVWKKAPVSQNGASRGYCRNCKTLMFWDAALRDTVSLAVATLSDTAGLRVAGHLWVSGSEVFEDAPSYREGLPPTVAVGWTA